MSDAFLILGLLALSISHLSSVLILIRMSRKIDRWDDVLLGFMAAVVANLKDDTEDTDVER